MKRAFFALFSLAIASPGWAQSGEKVEAPSYKPGDSWTYVRTDAMDRSRNAKYVDTITSVSDKGHETSRQGVEGTFNVSGSAQYTREINPVSLEDQRYEPYAPVFSFPLTPGKKWQGTYVLWIDGRPWNVTRSSRVEGWETVKTAAGEFKTLKITYLEQRRAGRASNDFKGTSWYSPEVRRAVISEFTALTPRREQRLELVGFKPAQ